MLLGYASEMAPGEQLSVDEVFDDTAAPSPEHVSERLMSDDDARQHIKPVTASLPDRNSYRRPLLRPVSVVRARVGHDDLPGLPVLQ